MSSETRITNMSDTQSPVMDDSHSNEKLSSEEVTSRNGRHWLETTARLLLVSNGLLGFLSLVSGNHKQIEVRITSIAFYTTAFAYFVTLRSRRLGLLRYVEFLFSPHTSC
jgi:hypothetical protein